MVELTKDADKLLCCAYKMYLERRKSGSSKDVAKEFEKDFYLSDKHLCNWQDDDVLDTIYELYKADLIRVDIAGNFALKPSAIIYMENRFKNGLNEITDFVSKFI